MILFYRIMYHLHAGLAGWGIGTMITAGLDPLTLILVIVNLLMAIWYVIDVTQMEQE